MKRRGSWTEWRALSRRETLTACTDDMRDAHNLDLSHDVVCKSWRPGPDYWTMRPWDHACVNSRVEVHARCVEGALGLGDHLVIGVVRLVARFHHAYAIPSVEFFPSGYCSAIVHLSSDCILWASISSVTKLLHTFKSRKRFIWGVVFTTVWGTEFRHALVTIKAAILAHNPPRMAESTLVWTRRGCNCTKLSKVSGKLACPEDDGKSCLHKSLSDSSEKCPSIHEVWKWLLMERYSHKDMLSNVMLLHPTQLEIQRFCLQFWVDPWCRKIRSPNSSVRNPLTRDLSGLSFVELQNGYVFITCW